MVLIKQCCLELAKFFVLELWPSSVGFSWLKVGSVQAVLFGVCKVLCTRTLSLLPLERIDEMAAALLERDYRL